MYLIDSALNDSALNDSALIDSALPCCAEAEVRRVLHDAGDGQAADR
ncbi:hypothetical protein [uncultured Amnibacterium sp.]